MSGIKHLFLKRMKNTVLVHEFKMMTSATWNFLRLRPTKHEEIRSNDYECVSWIVKNNKIEGFASK